MKTRKTGEDVLKKKAKCLTCIKKGFAAFSVKKNGDADKKIKEFDPELEKIILIPQMAGGKK